MRVNVSVAVVVLMAVALVGGGFGGCQGTGEDASTPTPESQTPAPGTFDTLSYDQKHTVCTEAAELFEQEANALAPSGRQWPTAKPTFYSNCMDCGGPTEVYGYIIAEGDKLGCDCTVTTYGLKSLAPEGAKEFWP